MEVLFSGPVPGQLSPSDARHLPRAPSPAQGVTFCGVASWVTWEGVTLPSSLLRTHALDQNPLLASVFPCAKSPRRFDESLLEVGPSRRYLCESFSTCLDPYPGCLCGVLTRFFPQSFGLPAKHTRSALSLIHTIATSVWEKFRGCSHSLMFKPADRLATQIAPAAASIFLAEQP